VVTFGQSITPEPGYYTMTSITLLPYDGRFGNVTLVRPLAVGLGVADVNVDYIITVESMGIHIAAVMSQKTGLPVNIVRKKQYWLPGEIVLDQTTGYGKGKLYINYVKKGDRVLVVDAVISTGGTLVAVLGGLKKAGVIVKDVVCVVERGEGKTIVKKETGFDVKTLVKIDVKEKVNVLGGVF
jgi:adenine phosphoribosyltransferase